MSADSISAESFHDIANLKAQHRRDLAKLSFDEKIEVLIRMQKIAREMAQAAGREFRGVVWGQRPHVSLYANRQTKT